MNPQQAWEAAQGQLQMEMPKAAYDTWVRDARLISYRDGDFTIGVINAYTRDWLESRLTSSISRLLTGMMKRSIEVHFVVLEGENAFFEDFADKNAPHDLPLQVQVIHQSLRAAFTEPQKVVVIPGYFRRWVPFLGPTLAWIVVAFRQLMYLSTRGKARENVTFRTSPQQVASWAGIARNTLWRNMKDHRIRWFLNQPDPDTHRYQFVANMPLTPGDAERLHDFLVRAGSREAPLTALDTALNTPIATLWEHPLPPPKEVHLEMEPRPQSVQDVVLAACGTIKASLFKQVTEKADELAAYLQPTNDVIIVSHYFLRNWVKHLGTAPAWFITLLRDRCFISKDEVRNTVWIHGGDAEIAKMLGLCRPKTISEWLTPLEDSRFERPFSANPVQKNQPNHTSRREKKREQVGQFVARVDYRDREENTAWQFKVKLVEPLIQQDQEAYDRAVDLVKAVLELGSIELLEEILNCDGADGTADGANGTISAKAAARLEQAVARMEQPGGANGTADGADGTMQGRVWNALSSLIHLKEPLLNILNHLKETSEALSTTTTANLEETAGTAQTQKLVLVDDIPDTWHLPSLLSSTQLHPGTRQKLLVKGIESRVLISHLLYAHSRDAGDVQNPLALVGSALISDPQSGFGGYYDVLAKRPPQELAEMIKRAHDYALRYPYEYSQNWQSGNQAWDHCMSRTSPERLQQLACRLGFVRMG